MIPDIKNGNVFDKLKKAETNKSCDFANLNLALLKTALLH